MTVSKKEVYVCSDGKEYKTEKAAIKHENVLLAEKSGLNGAEVDKYIKEIGKRNKKVRMLSYSEPWQEWSTHLVKELLKLIKNFDPNEVTLIVEEEKNRFNNDVKRLFAAKTTSYKSGELPKEIKDFLEEKNKEGKNGKYKVVEQEDSNEYLKKYTLKFIPLTFQEKLKKGIELNNKDMQEMLWQCPEIYEEEGEDSRWTRSMLTVVEFENDLYAIEWDKGLTEQQDDGFYIQPYKVKLKEEEVVVIKTTVERVE